MVGLVGQKIAVAISKTFCVVIAPSLAQYQILSKSDKNTEVGNFSLLVDFGGTLVGLVGGKMDAATSNIQLSSGR